MEKTERIALRASVRERDLLYQASRASETTLSDFVLDAARTAAENVLADRTRFQLPVEQWTEFVELLDRPTLDRPRLRGLLTEPSVLDR
ncbi:MAG: DUF1778 domain-containing protein [Chloroflexota bacterium]|nr:DUF1778 domain-containing protein [Chloroflexota bacterium]